MGGGGSCRSLKLISTIWFMSASGHKERMQLNSITHYWELMELIFHLWISQCWLFLLYELFLFKTVPTNLILNFSLA